MATDKQKQANQKNAQRSTGPRTSKGKAMTSKNAMKHGLLSQAIVYEDPNEFEQHYLGLKQCFLPANTIEENLVQIIAYIDKNNENPKPFVWTKSAEEILEKVNRARATLVNIQSN